MPVSKHANMQTVQGRNPEYAESYTIKYTNADTPFIAYISLQDIQDMFKNCPKLITPEWYIEMSKKKRQS